MATAPRGSGVVMMPAMVARKMESRCQAGSVTPAGGGANQMPAPRAMQMPSFFRSAPHLMPEHRCRALAAVRQVALPAAGSSEVCPAKSTEVAPARPPYRRPTCAGQDPS